MIDKTNGLNLDMVKLSDIISYLQANGWRRVKYDDKRLTVFTKPDPDLAEERPLLITLPANEQFRDYPARIAETVAILADIENTSFDDVLHKILLVGRDIIYLRLSLVRNAYLSLEKASRFIEGMRDLVAWGACMEREPRRSFEQPFHEAREQAEHFQLAHTFQGSFGFTIESQITVQNTLWQGYEPIPLQRKVLERITRGFLFTQHAALVQQPDEISQHFAKGFNANMCKAVVEMLSDIQYGQVAYSVRWSTHLQPSEDVAHVEPIVLRRDTADYLRQAAKHLERTAADDLKDERTIEGPVINLDFDGQRDRSVTILVEGTGKVNFTLNEEDYRVAGHAHLSGHTVRVTGRLTRPSKRKPFTLVNPHNFQMSQ